MQFVSTETALDDGDGETSSTIAVSESSNPLKTTLSDGYGTGHSSSSYAPMGYAPMGYGAYSGGLLGEDTKAMEADTSGALNSANLQALEKVVSLYRAGTSKQGGASPETDLIGAVEQDSTSWNDWFQRTLDVAESTANVTTAKYQKLNELNLSFVNAAAAYAKVIIAEQHLSEDNKTVKVKALGGVAGGKKLVAQGILFKFPSDQEVSDGLYLYGGSRPSHELAARAARQELKAANAYFPFHTNGIRVPLQVQIDYLGQRVIAMPFLALKPGGRVYGSGDGGRTVVSSHTAFNAHMDEAAHALHLAKHFVCDSTTQLSCAADVEALEGSDGRVYLLDLARVFPPEHGGLTTHLPMLPQAVFYRLMRPELLQRWKAAGKPALSSDALSAFGRGADEDAQNACVQQCTQFLLDTVIPEFVENLRTLTPAQRQLFDSDPVVLLHQAGINARHLGLVYRHLLAMPPPAEAAAGLSSSAGPGALAADAAASASAAAAAAVADAGTTQRIELAAVVLAEMVVRTLKNLLRAMWRAVSETGTARKQETSQALGAYQRCLSTTAEFFNLLTGATSSAALSTAPASPLPSPSPSCFLATQSVWRNDVRYALRARFGVDLSEALLAHVEPQLASVLHRCCRAVGVVLTDLCKSSLSQSAVGFTFSLMDFALDVHVRTMSVVDYGQSQVAFAQALGSLSVSPPTALPPCEGVNSEDSLPHCPLPLSEHAVQRLAPGSLRVTHPEPLAGALKLRLFQFASLRFETALKSSQVFSEDMLIKGELSRVLYRTLQLEARGECAASETLLLQEFTRAAQLVNDPRAATTAQLLLQCVVRLWRDRRLARLEYKAKCPAPPLYWGCALPANLLALAPRLLGVGAGVSVDWWASTASAPATPAERSAVLRRTVARVRLLVAVQECVALAAHILADLQHRPSPAGDDLAQSAGLESLSDSKSASVIADLYRGDAWLSDSGADFSAAQRVEFAQLAALGSAVGDRADSALRTELEWLAADSYADAECGPTVRVLRACCEAVVTCVEDFSGLRIDAVPAWVRALMGTSSAVNADFRAPEPPAGTSAMVAAVEAMKARPISADSLHALVVMGAELNTALTSRGDTLLMLVCKYNDTVRVEQLLKLDTMRRLDVDASDKLGRTALARAARYGHLKLVDALRAAGADILKPDNFGNSALAHAKSQGKWEVVKMLHSKSGAGKTSDFLTYTEAV